MAQGDTRGTAAMATQDGTHATAVAWTCLAVAAVFYGIMYAPARGYPTYDGVMFQWYMGVGIVYAAVVIQLCLGPTVPPSAVEEGCTSYTTIFPVYHEGLIGGCWWAISNILVVPTVKLLGLGVGFTLYHSINLVMGYLNGRLGLYGLTREEASWEMDMAQIWFLMSFVLITTVHPTLDEEEQLECADGGTASEAETPPSPGVCGAVMPLDAAAERSAVSFGGRGEAEASGEGAPGGGAAAGSVEPTSFWSTVSVQLLDPGTGPNASHWLDPASLGRKASGVVLGVVGGYFTSLCMVPYVLWEDRYKRLGIVPSPYHFAFSQCFGIFFCSTTYVLLASAVHRTCSPARTWPPQPTVVPPFVAGAMWAFGFVLSTMGVETLGFDTGYVMTAVGPVGLSALVSHFVFHEIQGRANQVKFWGAIALQAVGVLLDTAFRP